ncbi:MAG: hypothetical protein LBB41_02630 [Prevotellaceae bacterium]|jgi:hypothetical protein|nr:hypothetical protein [Prevotellaceae bacterium]
MPKVKGKEQLCSCEKYKTWFKSIQGLGGHTLFNRYSDIENIVNNRIDENYRHFLAQPEVDDDTIYWFSKPYSETPRRLSELQGTERARYEQVKDDTFSHYQSVISSLKSEGKNSEAECLENAVKFINDDFVYCFDGKTVLGIWGMQLKEHVREPLGIAMKNASFKQKDKPEPPVPDKPPTEEPPNKPDTGHEPEEQPKNPYTVRFNAGENGNLDGISEYSKHAGENVKPNEVPTVKPKEGYEFAGWDKSPNDYTITGDTEFTAQYREIPPIVVTESWWSRFWLTGKGCLNWLLLLLLLALIFMVIWCCLLKKCNFNFCGCDCEETTVVIPEPKIKPEPNPDIAPVPTPTPTTGDVQFLLKWNNYNDLDLSCIDPSGATISYMRRESPTGGILEIDMNVGDNRSLEPIENIYWQAGNAPAGTYKVYLTYYAIHDNVDDTPYSIKVKYGDTVEDFNGTIKKSDGKIHICTFTFPNQQ